MLCSSRELQLGDDHSGIIDLPADTKTGMPAAEALGLDDAVIEIKVTPNRGDCLGVHGIARDLAAAGVGTLKPFTARADQGHLRQPDQVDARLRGQARQPLPDRGRPPFPRREERPLARLAAAPAEGDRAAADLDSGRHHQPRDVRPQSAPARVRREEAQRRPRHAPGARGRNDPGARRQDLRARSVDLGDRRFEGGARHRRRDGRRGDRRAGGHHRGVPRGRLLHADQGRRDRPQARHPVRRALPLRARHRSAVGRVGHRCCYAPDPRAVRRRGERDHPQRRDAGLGAQLHAARRPGEDPDRDRRAGRGRPPTS